MTIPQRTILVERHPHEIHVAIFDDNRLVDYRVAPDIHSPIVGAIHWSRVRKVQKSMEAAFVDVGMDRDGFLFGKDYCRSTPKSPKKVTGLSEGTGLITQIVKEPLGKKGVRLSTRISLPGALCVYLPYSSTMGISRSITSDSRRRQLRKWLGSFRDQIPGGFILRTAAADVERKVLQQEMQGLVERWQWIQMLAFRTKNPGLLVEDDPLVLQMLRECFSKGDSRVLCDDGQIAALCREYLGRIDPKWALKVAFEKGEDLFEREGVWTALDSALRKKVKLPSGGYLIIQATEALVAVDVNSGKDKRGSRVEEMALGVNLEAAEELAIQLRLRNLGGIIIVEFIDLGSAEHRGKTVV